MITEFERMSDPLENFTKSTFSGSEGDTFRLRVETGERADLVLVEATARDTERPRPFSLVFEGPGDLSLRQGRYAFEHETIGAFELFIVPIGPNPETGRLRYEAVFN